MNIPAAIEFHRRRLSEFKKYDEVLAAVVFRETGKPNSLQISYERLLKQPDAYEILLLIWIASPYSQGLSDWSGWECSQTAYRLATELSGQKTLPAVLNYVTRVVDAAVAKGLVEREVVAANRIWLRGTALLNTLMLTYASACATSDDYEK